MSFSTLSLTFFIGLSASFSLLLMFSFLRTSCFSDNFQLTSEVEDDSKIDIVFTWVNGSDPIHKENLQKALHEYYSLETDSLHFLNITKHGESVSSNRFSDHDELLYALRSLERYAPWINRVFIVTNGQVPAWLNLTNPRVSVVTHKDIFPDSSHLPTFSSPAIESNIFRIPGLSKRFLYSNDDFFFLSTVSPNDFLTYGGKFKIYFHGSVPPCAKGCQSEWIGNGRCDRACNVTECNFDGGDCVGVPVDSSQSNWWSDRNQRRQSSKNFCNVGCLISWIGDGYCDEPCNTESCAYDAGDCDEKILSEASGGALFQINKNVLNSSKSMFKIDKNITYLVIEFSDSKDEDEIEIIESFTSRRKIPYVHISWNHDSTLISRVILSKSYKRLVILLFDSTSNLFDFEDIQGPIREVVSVSVGIEGEKTANHTIGLSFYRPLTKVDIPEMEPQNLATGEFVRLGPMDTYGESLTFVDLFYHDRYGPRKRMVPAHAPIIIDREIVARFWEAFPAELTLTSSRKFRHPHNMQFQFSYAHFLIQELEKVPIDKYILSTFDFDNSGTISESELRFLMAAHFYESVGLLRPIGIQPDEIPEIIANLTSCGYSETTLVSEWANDCEWLEEILTRDGVLEKNVNQVDELVLGPRYGFEMMISSKEIFQIRLDRLRRGVGEMLFACINDDLDYDHPETTEVLEMTNEFFETLFPQKSSFELSEGANEVLWLE